MFTGIVQATVRVAAVERKPQLSTLILALPAALQAGLAVGASVAVNGTCLTVTVLDGEHVHFDVMMETLRVTNLGALDPGDAVNVERAARYGDEIGGHPLSGHVHGQAEVVAVDTPENNRVLTLRPPAELLKYILPKGYVALNGCSLTVGEVGDGTFTVYLIPETLRVTIFGHLGAGARVNLEIDGQTQAIVDTVERVLAARAGA